MADVTLHLHEPRLGLGLPSRTVRPYARRGDSILAALLGAFEVPADRVVLTGRLFESANPAAHLVDRLVRALGDLTARGIRVHVPAEAPRALLFLAAGVSLGTDGFRGDAPEFWRTGRFALHRGETVDERQVELPGVADVRIDLTGLGSAEAFSAIRDRLREAAAARFIRLRLTGRTAERELRAIGPRELVQLLPGGVGGTVENLVASLDPAEAVEVPVDDEERRALLRAVRSRLPDVPRSTGIYEFVDAKGRVLYVGKAVDLRRRVLSHFTAEAREPSPRGPMLLAVRDLAWQEVPTEVEALLAEAARIRESRPPYNRLMRETEGYRYLRADLDAAIPTLDAVPEGRGDGAARFGPFPKRWAIERSLRTLMVVFGLKSCDWSPGRPVPPVCTDRDLNVCSAPCAGRVSLREYRERLCSALDHLLGIDGGEPPFGTLNGPGAGLLGREDLRILDGFRRSVRWFLLDLRNANGGLRLSDGRTLLVLGGLRAGIRQVEEAEADRWVATAVLEFKRKPPRTFVPLARVEEVRILAGALRRASGAAGEPGPSGDTSGDAPAG